MRFVLALVCLATAPAIFPGGITKCQKPDGKIYYTDKPCVAGATGEALDLSGRIGVAPKANAVQATDAVSTQESKPKSEQDKIRELGNRLSKENRKIDIGREIEVKEKEIRENHAAMDEELSALQAAKSKANNNLAGATYEGSLSAEMQAVVGKYESRNRTLQSKIDALRDEASRL